MPCLWPCFLANTYQWSMFGLVYAPITHRKSLDSQHYMWLCNLTFKSPIWQKSYKKTHSFISVLFQWLEFHVEWCYLELLKGFCPKGSNGFRAKTYCLKPSVNSRTVWIHNLVFFQITWSLEFCPAYWNNTIMPQTVSDSSLNPFPCGNNTAVHFYLL